MHKEFDETLHESFGEIAPSFEPPVTIAKSYDLSTRSGRLLRLADLLDTVPPARFETEVWHATLVDSDHPNFDDADQSEYDEDRFYYSPSGTQIGDEGTVSSAEAWATTIPEFQVLGFRMAPHNVFPKYGSDMAHDAVASFFMMNRDDVQTLFGFDEGNGGVGPEAIADGIREFVRDNPD